MQLSNVHINVCDDKITIKLTEIKCYQVWN